MNEDFSKEDLDILTPAEREALAAEDLDEGVLAEIAADDDEEKVAVEAKEVEKVADEDQKEEVETPFVPSYEAEAVAGYDDEMAALTAQKTSLLKSLMDDEINTEEYAKREAEITSKREALIAQNLKSEISAEQAEQFSKQKWQWEIDRFMKQSLKEDGLDFKMNKVLNAALDAAVKDLAVNPDNKDRDSTWFLEEGAKIVKSNFGIGKAVNTPVNEKAKVRQPDLSGVPPNIGRLPVAADPVVSADEFGYLDKLQGIDFEKALMKLTPDQREKWIQ